MRYQSFKLRNRAPCRRGEAGMRLALPPTEGVNVNRLAELVCRDFVACALSSAASLGGRTPTGRLGLQATHCCSIALVPASLKAPSEVQPSLPPADFTFYWRRTLRINPAV